MNIKSLTKKGQYAFEKNKGLIFTVMSAGFEIVALIAMAKQAPKAERILVPANKKINKLKSDMEDKEAVANNLVYPEDNKKAIRKIQMDTVVKLAKVYSVPVILTGLSLTFMGGSYKVMKDKQVALGAAYVTLDSAFKSYRKRVKDAIGEEEEEKIFRDRQNSKIKKSVIDAETGEITEIEETISKSKSGGAWEVYFDAASLLWTKSGRSNYEILMSRQEQANIQLRTNGYLFLYDVLDMLEIPKSTINKDLLAASRCIGWIYDPYDSTRSSWVSFGISDEYGHYINDGENLFNNVEKDALLSFNCDGNILLDKPSKKSFTFYVKN